MFSDDIFQNLETQSSERLPTQDVVDEQEEEGDREPPRTQGDNPNDAGFDKSFRIFSMKHIIHYYEIFIPGIISSYQLFESRKVIAEYHKQIAAIILICRKLTSMLTASSNALRENIFETMCQMAIKFDICKFLSH